MTTERGSLPSTKTSEQRRKNLTLVRRNGQSEGAAMAESTLRPAINAAVVVDAYQDHVLGNDLDMNTLVDTLQANMGKSNSGDMSELENMLIGQATALQTIFVSLARRAQSQQYQRNLEAFLGLALKAQAQSRATIQAIVDLKYPRQATFVKQANIANGPQQVNNGMVNTRTLENQTEQIEVLEGLTHGSKKLDTRAAAAAERSNSRLETMAAGDRPKKRSRQG
jgi:hypothetical protein